MNSINSNEQGVRAEDLMPSNVYNPMTDALTMNSTLVARRKVRFNPQSGTASATAGNSLVWIIQDTASLLDPQSVRFSTTCTTTANTMDDGPAFIGQHITNVAGAECENTLRANRFCNAKTYAGASKSWYSSLASSFAGNWALNPSLGVTTGAYATVANILNFGDVSGCSVASAQRYVAGQTLSVPLSLVSDFWSQKTYLPLLVMGQIQVSLVLASNAEAIYAPTGSPTYTLTNSYLEYDLVAVNPSYANLLKSSAMSSEHAISIPFNACQLSGNGIAVTTGTNSVVVSMATNYLRRSILTLSPSNAVDSYTYPGVSCFPNAGVNSIQYVSGSYIQPQQPADTQARLANLTQQAFGGGDPLHMDCNGVGDINVWGQTTSLSGVGSPLAKQPWGDSCIHAHNYDAFQSGESQDLDGISVAGMSGGQLTIQLGVAGANGLTSFKAFVHTERTRILHIANGGITVKGV